MKYLLGFVLVFIHTTAFCQTDSVILHRPQHLYGIYFRKGETVVHTVAVQNIKGVQPFVVEAEVAKRKIDFDSWNKSGCFATTGFLFSYFDFNTAILGNGAALSYFIRPAYRIGNRLTAYYQAGIGIDYLSNPFNETKNPTNRNYSLHLNPYMHVGVGVSYQPVPHFILTANGVFHHTSNGEIRQPNKGINWKTAALGLIYTPSNSYLPKYKRDLKIRYTSRQLTVDAGITLTPKQGYYTQRTSQRTFIGGVMIQLTKAFTNTNAITGGVSSYYSHYTIKSTTSPINKMDPVLAGVHAGHAFLLGKITFSQQVGIYFLNPTSFIPATYQQWNLTYLFGKHVHAGVGLRANADNADFTDVKMLYRF